MAAGTKFLFNLGSKAILDFAGPCCRREGAVMTYMVYAHKNRKPTVVFLLVSASWQNCNECGRDHKQVSEP